MYRILYLFIFALVLPSGLKSQQVSTLLEEVGASFEAISWSTDGKIFMVDFMGGRLLQIQRDGALISLKSGLRGPLGGAFAADGNFYFSVFGDGTLLRYDTSGNLSTIARDLGGPTGVLIDDSNNKAFVNDYYGNTTWEVDLANGSTKVRGKLGGLNGPDGVVFAPNGYDLLIANFEDNLIHRIDTSGNVSLFTRLTGSSASGYLVPFGDDYLIAGLKSQQVWKISAAGEVSSFAGTGGTGGLDNEVNEGLANSTFLEPNGIALSPDADTLLLSEKGQRIRLITGLRGLVSSRSLENDAVELKLSPNPTNEEVVISYSLPAAGPAELKLYDLGGRLVDQQRIPTQGEGEQSLRWQRKPTMGKGTYLFVLEVNGRVVGKQKMLLQ
ncbi:MAG: T9SS type A sorting domain-containing protein [Bacteroidota bacterium]